VHRLHQAVTRPHKHRRNNELVITLASQGTYRLEPGCRRLA